MTEYNQIQEGSLNRALQARLNTDDSAPAPVVAPELTPGLVLENDRPEWGWPKGERLAAGNGGVTAVGAQFSQVALVNPSTSRQLVTVEQLYIAPAAAAVIRVGTFVGDPIAFLVNTLNFATRDTRWNDPSFAVGAPSCRVRGGTNAAVLTFYGELVRFQVTASSMPPDGLRLNAVLHPGWSLVMAVNTVNVAIDAFHFTWRERPLLPNESATNR